jgi:glutamine cyclotransferase
VDGLVYGNVYTTGCIAQVDASTGRVEGWALLGGLRAQLAADTGAAVNDAGEAPEVLNGIAWDPDGRRLFVTGKLWPRVYEIELVPVEDAGGEALAAARAACIVPF